MIFSLIILPTLCLFNLQTCSRTSFMICAFLVFVCLCNRIFDASCILVHMRFEFGRSIIHGLSSLMTLSFRTLTLSSSWAMIFASSYSTSNNRHGYRALYFNAPCGSLLTCKPIPQAPSDSGSGCSISMTCPTSYLVVPSWNAVPSGFVIL